MLFEKINYILIPFNAPLLFRASFPNKKKLVKRTSISKVPEIHSKQPNTVVLASYVCKSGSNGVQCESK